MGCFFIAENLNRGEKMPIKRHEMVVDIIKHGAKNRNLAMRHNDTNHLEITLTENGEVINLTDYGLQTIVLMVTRFDGQVVDVPGSITEEGKAKFILDGDSLAVEGYTEAVAQFYGTDGRVSSITFAFQTLRDPSANFVPQSKESTLIEIVLRNGPLAVAGAQKAEEDLRTFEAELVVNEQVRQTSESNRLLEENQRSIAEESRQLAEGARVTAENERVVSEGSRKDAEALRVNAETIRQASENTRKSDENSRKQVENVRVQNESTRQSAEEERATAEMNRVTSENQRILAESARENDFIASQTQRENTFTASEESRQSIFTNAETAREQTFNTKVEEVDTAITQSQAATNNANSAAASANNKVTELNGYNTRLTGVETETANARQSAVKGKNFANVDARFEEVEGDTFIPMKNEVVNGDFSNGTTGWTLAGGGTDSLVTSPSISGNALRQLKEAKSRVAFQEIKGNVGDKLYFSVYYFLQTYTNGTYLVNFSDHGTYSNLAFYNLPSTATGIWNRMSGIWSNSKGDFRLSIGSLSGDTRTIVIDNIALINLTQVFGKGNEPTTEEMDRLLAKYPNSFFDGTVNLTPKLLDDLRYLTSDVHMPITNEVLNTDAPIGGFGNSWRFGGNITDLVSNITDKSLEFTGAGSASNSAFNWVHFGLHVNNFEPNQIYYVSATARVISGSGNVFIGVGYGTSTWSIGANYSHISRVGTTIPSTSGGRENFVIGADLGVKIAFKNPVFLNLTKIFGVGNEPSKESMDALLATYPNGWFDGTVNLAENKRIIPFLLKRLELKADKAQEAWITPTLLNGAVDYSVYQRVQYRKNKFGNIEIRGYCTPITPGQTLFTLPLGYRPSDNTGFVIGTAGTNRGAILEVSAITGGVTPFGIFSTYLAIQGEVKI